MISVEKIYTLLFYIGLFFLPFNAFNGFLPIGEFQQEASFFFFFFGFFFILLSNSIKIPTHKIALLLYLFIFWCLLSSFFNFNTIIHSYFKQTFGISRFIRQYFVLLISAFFFVIYYWNIFRLKPIKDLFLIIRKIFLLSLSFCSFIGFMEILIGTFHIKFLTYFFNLFNYLPFTKVSVLNTGRIKTVSFEPPFLAIYLISIFAWMLSYIITEKKWYKFIPSIVVLFLTFFSGSRTALITIFIQLLVFIFISLNTKKNRKYIIHLFLFFVILGCISSLSLKKQISEKINSLNFKDNFSKSVSNKSRFGMQYSSFQVFKKHPLIGVGFGQQAYYNKDYYPKWATKNNYEFTLWYNNEKIKAFPPGYNLYTRILAELGGIGLLIFILFIFSTFYYSSKLRKFEKYSTYGNILLISFIGLSINWLQIDTFRIFTFWIFTAILIYTIKYKNQNDGQ